MKNLMVPTRPAPSIEDAKKSSSHPSQSKLSSKPPPRPPPPNFHKAKSKSEWSLGQQVDGTSLIDLSPPVSPNHFVASRNRAFGGSVSSSYSSSTSSLASSKKSFEYDVNFDPWSSPTLPPVTQSSQFGLQTLSDSSKLNRSTFYGAQSLVVPQTTAPTIIRIPSSGNKSAPVKSSAEQRTSSPPMPSVPPPSPPKDVSEIVTPFAIAIYDFPGSHHDDLPFQVNDVVLLLRRVSNEWLYGRVDDREGIFPSSFVDVQVPLPGEENVVRAVYQFEPQMPGDLRLQPGQEVLVTGRVSSEWLLGESNGQSGQFPANFVNRVPSHI